jgi:hypothetical protein
LEVGGVLGRRRALTPDDVRAVGSAGALHGCARRVGGVWLAECYEVGIAAPGDTREEARANLGEALRRRLAAAEAGHPLPAPAPWYGLRMLAWRVHWWLEGRPGFEL